MLFWVVKILTTGVGEIFSDYICLAINRYLAVALGLLFLIIALVLQLKVRRHLPYVYWFAALMVSIFGTMFADVLHVGLGIPYLVSTITYVVVLALAFVIWWRVEKTLAVHSIVTTRRELFYWLTVLLTFALGTATGDLTAVTFHLGYLMSAVLFAVLICIPLFGYKILHWNEVFSFWFAYILTRPLGASVADWISASHVAGGLGLGKGLVSLALFLIIAVLVAYLTLQQRRKEKA